MRLGYFICIILFLIPGLISAIGQKPEEVFLQLVAHAREKNWNALYEGISNSSLRKFEQVMKEQFSALKEINMDKDNKSAERFQKLRELEDLSGREFFISLFELEGERTATRFLPPDIVIIQSKIYAQEAVLLIKTKARPKSREKVLMIWENEGWKLDLNSKLKRHFKP